MRTVHDLDPSLQTVIVHDPELGWSVEVNATVNLHCIFGEEHAIPIHALLRVGHHTDRILLDRFEWAIRGRRDAVLQLTTLIIDDEIQAHFIDPCLG